jgi:hypothetical protein
MDGEDITAEPDLDEVEEDEEGENRLVTAAMAAAAPDVEDGTDES